MNLSNLVHGTAILFIVLLEVCVAAPVLIESTDEFTKVSLPVVLENGSEAIKISSENIESNNIFYDFSKFGLDSGQEAHFLNATKLTGAVNLLSRVTGNDETILKGVVLADGFDSANLFLFNKNGIKLRGGASFRDFSSVHLSTAQQLIFEGGGVYSSSPSTDEVLVSSPPKAFGFLDNQAEEIGISGVNISDGINSKIAFYGGDISVKDSVLNLKGGEILLNSYASNDGAAYFNNSQIDGAVKKPMGDITLQSTDIGKKLEIKADRIIINSDNLKFYGVENGETNEEIERHNETNVKLEADSLIDINLLDKLELRDGSRVTGKKRGAKITIDAKQLDIGKNSVIRQNKSGSSIKINSSILSLDGGQIKTRLTGIDTDSGDIEIDVDDVSLSGGYLSSVAGDIRVSLISTSTNSTKTGVSGSISITGKNRMNLSDGAKITAVSAGSTAQTRGGNILISGFEDLRLSSGSKITNEAINQGAAGDIKFEGIGTIVVEDKSRISAESSADPSDFSENPENKKQPPGNIIINTKRLISDNGSITVKSEKTDAGIIDIDMSERLDLKNGSLITTSAIEGEGDGGQVTVDGGLVLIRDTSKIEANTAGGFGGNVVFTAQSVLGATIENVTAIAKTPEGLDGQIEFNTPDVDATTGTLELPETYFDAASLIANRCATQDSSSSSFIVSERDGLGSSPDLLLAGYEYSDKDIHSDFSAKERSTDSGIQVATIAIGISCSR